MPSHPRFPGSPAPSAAASAALRAAAGVAPCAAAGATVCAKVCAKVCATAFAVLAGLLLLSGLGRVAGQSFVYTLTDTGRICVNGTILDKMQSSFDPASGDELQTAFFRLETAGSNRYALRRDGRLVKNGKSLYKLPFATTPGASHWFGLSIVPGTDPDPDTVYALRTDGLLTSNGVTTQNFPDTSPFFYFQVLAAPPHVWSLRTDGSIFRDTSLAPWIKFVGGPSTTGALDGAAAESQWIGIAINPADGFLFALRRDGKVFKVDPDEAPAPPPPLEGVSAGDFPFPPTGVDPKDWYSSLDFDSAGTLYVQRVNGQVYTVADFVTPLATLPGNFNPSDFTTYYYDIETEGLDFWALRADGKVFKNPDGTGQPASPVGANYIRVTVDTEPPDLSSFKNPKPVAAVYKTRALLGQPITIPVLPSDIEKLPADLVLTAPDPLPAGAVWDDVARTLTWPDPQPAGVTKFSLTVSDGVNPPRTFKYAIAVFAPDTNLDKNKAPLVSKVTPVQALAGYPVSFPILAVDLDGDPLTITAITTKTPFTLGATFDGPTATFSWTPGPENIGKFNAFFQVSDGIKTVTFPVQIKVVNPLIF